MKSLPALIRLKQQELDKRRRMLVALEQEAVAVKRRIQALDEEMAIESLGVYSSGGPAFGIGDYFAAARRRRQALEEELAAVNERIAPVHDYVAEAYQELKRFELAQQGFQERAAAAAGKREQAALDEVGLAGFRRRQNP